MHVLMIAQYFPPDFGGASTRAYNAAIGLKLQGCNVTVITAFPHYPAGKIHSKYKNKILSEEELDGIRVIRTWVPRLPHSSVSKRLLLHFSFFLSSLLAMTKIKEIDVIFASNASFFVIFPALAYKLFFHKNIIRNVDDLWPEVFYDLGYVKSRLFRKILDFIAGLSYSIPAAVVPVSYGYVQTLITKYHVPKEKIIVIEHGVDTTKFHRLQRNSDSNRQTKTIMYSGVLGLGYDFEIVVKCAKLLESQPVHFVIRGVGELESKLKQMVEEHAVKNLEIRTELLSNEKLISFLNTADIFLLPMSTVRGFDLGFPTKILESQALGKPILCVSNGEPARYVLQTQSGLATSSREPEEIAKLIMKLVNDAELAKQLGTNGFNNVNNNLTLEKIGKRLVDVISRCV